MQDQGLWNLSQVFSQVILLSMLNQGQKCNKASFCYLSSDTDSDEEWQKYREAAVSATDILKQSAFPALSQDHSWANVEHSQKKEKKKMIRGENNIQEKIIEPAEGDQICRGLPQLVSADGQRERGASRRADSSVLAGGVKKKKKKKEKKKGE